MNCRQIAKKIIPAAIVSKGWAMKEKGALIFRAACSKSPVLSSLYYLFGSRDFAREQQAVLRGLVAYDKIEGGRFLLRRNIHRLEKGLLMKERKPVFAADYIEETTQRYIKELSLMNTEPDCELRWFGDVLDLYFKNVSSNLNVDRARRVFDEKSTAAGALKEKMKTPYLRDSEAGSPVEYEALLELAKVRRSVRWFQRKAVPDTLIYRAMEVALLSPTACNRQPFRFHMVNDLTLAPKVSELAWGSAGYADNIPAVAVVIGCFGAFFSERDRHLPYMDASLAIMSFVYALETMGIGSCCLNWPDIKGVDAQMKEMINLSDDERVIMLIAFGYPDPEGRVAYSQKKSVSNVCTFN